MIYGGEKITKYGNTRIQKDSSDMENNQYSISVAKYIYTNIFQKINVSIYNKIILTLFFSRILSIKIFLKNVLINVSTFNKTIVFLINVSTSNQFRCVFLSCHDD